MIAEFIRVSYQSLQVIPAEHRFTMHYMYEDSDLPGAHIAETTFDFIDQEMPGTFVGVLANDSVTPPCCNSEGHYNCDYYEPYWYTVLIPAHIWAAYQEQVQAKDQEWKDAHQCKEQERE